MIYGECDYLDSWRKALTTVKYLKVLQNVNISIDWCQEYPLVGRWDFTGYGLTKLKKLSLKTATIIMSDQGAKEVRHINVANASADVLYRWTLNEKRERARYVKEVLLQSSR